MQQDRWEDLRCTVVESKGIDPVEIVFMQFLFERRFGFNPESGWQFDLLLGSVWNEILDICNSSLGWWQLANDANGNENEAAATTVIQDITTQGTALMIKLLQEEERRGKIAVAALPETQAPATEEVTYVETVVIEERPVTYYDPWYDPWYAPPWYSPWYW